MRWRLVDLVQWVSDEFGVSCGPDTIRRELKGMNYARLRARPQHPGQDEAGLEAFKKSFPARVDAIRADLPGGSEIEIW